VTKITSTIMKKEVERVIVVRKREKSKYQLYSAVVLCTNACCSGAGMGCRDGSLQLLC
jgi:hypothetical protein